VFALREGADRWFDGANLPTLALRGLDAEAATALLASRSPQLPTPVVDALVAGTSGNPLALLELPSALHPDQLSGRRSYPIRRTGRQDLFAAAAAASRPLEYARTRLVYGEALRRARQRSAARTHLRAAAEQFDRAGARLWAQRAAELRATGETIGTTGTTSIDVLTPQELHIARLAATGT
jgi:hypothetical protein